MTAKPPTPLTAKAEEQLVTLLAAGYRRSVAAARVGITSHTLRSIIRAGLGDNGEPLPGTMAERILEAEDSAAGDVELKLYEAAQQGQPWAVTLWLKAHLRTEYDDKAANSVTVNMQSNTTNNTLVVEGTPEDRRDAISRLVADLEHRRQLTLPAASTTVTGAPDGPEQDEEWNDD